MRTESRDSLVVDIIGGTVFITTFGCRIILGFLSFGHCSHPEESQDAAGQWQHTRGLGSISFMF